MLMNNYLFKIYRMSPELIAAVKERIAIGYSQEQIRGELQAAGYEEQVISDVYAIAQKLEAELPVPASSFAPAGMAGTKYQNQSANSRVLPTISELIQNSWQFLASRMDLAGLLLLTLIAPYIIAFIAMQGGTSSSFSILAGAVSFISTVLYFVTLGAILYIVMQYPQRRASLSEGFSWISQNFFALFWIFLLSFLTIFGGLLLLIIPGIIVSIYIYFAQFVFAAEGTRGLQALLRSRELVRNQGWPLIRKLLGLWAIIFLVYFGIGFVSSFILIASGNEGQVDMAVEVLIQVLGVVVTLMSMSIGAQLYRVLATQLPVTTQQTSSARTKYIVLAVLGLFAPFIFIGLVGLTLVTAGFGFSDFSSGDNREMSRVQSIGESPVLAEWKSGAEVYYVLNEESYLGYCAEVEQTNTEAFSVECNDSVEAYAITVLDATQQWCSDSTGFSKETFADLNDRLTCAMLPTAEELEQKIQTEDEPI